MKIAALLLLAAVQVGSGFGSATAQVDELTETGITVDIEVEVRTSAQAVVAHLGFGDDPELTLPLLDRGGGAFGIRTELDRKDYIVVFEAIGDEVALSEPVSLTDMGADLSTGGDSSPSGGGSDADGLSPETKRLGWLALGLAAASLSALAFWALGGRPSDSDEEE